MNVVALAALIDRLNVGTQWQNEKLKLVRWFRANASARQGIPFENGEDNSTLVGILNAVTTSTEVGGGNAGQTGGSDDSSAGQVGVGGSGGQKEEQDGMGGASGGAEGSGPRRPTPDVDSVTPATTTTTIPTIPGAATGGDGPHGPTQSDGAQSNTGAGQVVAPGNGSGGVGDSGGQISWKQWAAVSALLAGGAAAGTGIGLAFRGGDAGDTTVIEQPSSSLYPLLDWLEEHEYHEPIDRRDRR